MTLLGKGKITEITVTSQASKITIDRALRILAAAKEADPGASVDVIIYHIVEEREIDDEAKRRLGIDDEDPKVVRNLIDRVLERSDRR